MKKYTITEGEYDLLCAKIQSLENENSRLKGYIKGIKEQLRIDDGVDRIDLYPSTCPECNQPFTKENLYVKENCFNCGWEFAN